MEHYYGKQRIDACGSFDHHVNGCGLCKSSRSEDKNMIPVLIAIVVAFFVAGLIWLLVEWMTPKDVA